MALWPVAYDTALQHFAFFAWPCYCFLLPTALPPAFLASPTLTSPFFSCPCPPRCTECLPACVLPILSVPLPYKLHLSFFCLPFALHPLVCVPSLRRRDRRTGRAPPVAATPLSSHALPRPLPFLPGICVRAFTCCMPHCFVRATLTLHTYSLVHARCL